MTAAQDRYAQASEAIREAWGFWLHQHPVSLGDIITGAVQAAAAEWMNTNRDELLDRIAAEVAMRTPPGSPDAHR